MPYVNIAYSRDLAKGSTSVFADGGHGCAIKPSEFRVFYGDEPGKGGSVKSGMNQHRATWLSWPADVFIEGEPVCLLTDKMLPNRGNTISVGGEQQPPLDMESWLKELCEIACECKNAVRFQQCMAEKIEERFCAGDYPKDDSPYWREVSMKKGGCGWDVIRDKGGNAPTSNPITPSGGIRPDVVQTDGTGKPSRIIESKFPGDTPNANQQSGGTYSQAADDLGIPYDLIDVALECAFCWDPPPPPLPVPVPEPATDSGWGINWGAIGVGALVTLGGAAVIACVATIICGATAAGVTASVAVVGGAAVMTTGNTPSASLPES